MKRKTSTSPNGRPRGLDQDAAETRESFLRSLLSIRSNTSASQSDTSPQEAILEGYRARQSSRPAMDMSVPHVPQVHLSEPRMVPLHALPYETGQTNSPPSYFRSPHHPSNPRQFHRDTPSNFIPYPQDHTNYNQERQRYSHASPHPTYHQEIYQYRHPPHNSPYPHDARPQQSGVSPPYHVHQGTHLGSQEYELVTPSPARWKNNAGPGVDPENLKQVVSNPEVICNCAKSRCLKLYCECFQQGFLCNIYCRCVSCLNLESQSHDDGALFRAKGEYMSRKPGAFGKKKKKVGQGCSCRNNRCLKKYCACFREEIACSAKCTCIDCANVGTTEK